MPGYDERSLSMGGIDLQLLDSAATDNIGFNEPGAALRRERTASLKEATVKGIPDFLKSRKAPKQAYTMGIKSIMQARKIVIVVGRRRQGGHCRAGFHVPSCRPEVPYPFCSAAQRCRGHRRRSRAGKMLFDESENAAVKASDVLPDVRKRLWRERFFRPSGF